MHATSRLPQNAESDCVMALRDDYVKAVESNNARLSNWESFSEVELQVILMPG